MTNFLEGLRYGGCLVIFLVLVLALACAFCDLYERYLLAKQRRELLAGLDRIRQAVRRRSEAAVRTGCTCPRECNWHPFNVVTSLRQYSDSERLRMFHIRHGQRHPGPRDACLICTTAAVADGFARGASYG